MKKHILIIGKQGSGKPSKALEIIGQKRAYYCDGVPFTKLTQEIKYATLQGYDFIVIAGIDFLNKIEHPSLKIILTSRGLNVRGINFYVKRVPVPTIIFIHSGHIDDLPNNGFAKNHLEIIDLN